MKLSILQKITLLCLIESPVHDCPRIHEHDLEVEQNKKHRHHVKLHAEARLVLPWGIMPHSYGVSLAGVRFPLLPTSTLTTNAEAAKRMATRICRRPANIRLASGIPGTRRFRLFYTSKVAILLSDRVGQSRRQSLVFLAVLLDRASRHEIL